MKKFILREKLEEFIGLLKSGEIEVYNEFSFQHELGYFLRNQLKHYPGDFKIQFERNFKDLFDLSDDEIDVRCSRSRRWLLCRPVEPKRRQCHCCLLAARPWCRPLRRVLRIAVPKPRISFPM